MKKIYYNIIPGLILTLIFILSGCTKDDDKDTSSDYIHIFSSIQHPDLRVTGNDFDQGDEIGVFVVPYSSDNSTPGNLESADYANNIPHIYQGRTWQTQQGELIPWPGARNIDVYAYYPFDENASVTPRNYEFYVSADQSALDSYIFSDFLYARTSGISPSPTVPLQFSHSLSKVNINLKSEITLIKESFDLTEVLIQDIITGCHIDLSNGGTSLISATPQGISPLQISNPVSTFDLSLTAIVPPQTITDGTRFLRINNRGINYIYTTDEDITFQPGYTTTFNIEITQQGIIVTTSTINEWNDGGTINGYIGDKPPRILDLDRIDWEASYVHYIYDGNSLIAQVCREYLSRNTNPRVDVPAIVIYPMGLDGRMDLTKGFVARVYNRNRNSSYEYVFDTGDIHGGRAVFGNNNTLSSYDRGSLPLVNKVLIESADNISAASDNMIPRLNTRPYLLTDIDNNTYPITKIGTQYWIQENLKVEHYTDGSPLEYFYYNNNPEAYKNLLGALYTWTAVTNPAGIAPDGWRVPEKNDWYSLYEYVNPETGRKIKVPGMWNTPAYADNVTGFFALPAGIRTTSGAYNDLNSYGHWWSYTSNSTTNGWMIYVGDGTAITETSANKANGQSIRLMRDN